MIGEPAVAVLEVAQIVGLTDPAVAAVDVEQRTTLRRRRTDTQSPRRRRPPLHDRPGRQQHQRRRRRTRSRRSGSRSPTRAAEAIEPTPAGLATLAAVDASGLDPRLADARIIVMSDVNNPLTGERGATAIFGPQKGVPRERIAEIDRRIANFAALTERALDRRAQGQAWRRRRRRPRLRAAVDRRRDALGCGSRRRPDRPRRRARPARTGRSPAKAGATRRRRWARRR